MAFEERNELTSVGRRGRPVSKSRRLRFDALTVLLEPSFASAQQPGLSREPDTFPDDDIVRRERTRLWKPMTRRGFQ